MSVAWAVRLAQADAAAAERLRCVAGIEVCQHGEHVWLRVSAVEKELERTLRTLPGGVRYSILPDGQLLAVGARVPKGQLPPGPWTPLARWLAVELPQAALPGEIEARVPLSLVRGGQIEEPDALLTARESWVRYVVEAPQVRLDRLRFAAAADDRVFVHGKPLPPLAGQRCVVRGGVAVPTGWTWLPPVAPDVLRELLGLDGDDVAILRPDGAWERIESGEFVRAARAALRSIERGDDAQR
jgi:hypothetical protein